MDARDTLALYPFVVVRIACRVCSRSARYRLARLAAKYGSEFKLDDLLFQLSFDCMYRADDRTRGDARGCGIYLLDLDQPRPPDLPPGMARLKILKGGKV